MILNNTLSTTVQIQIDLSISLGSVHCFAASHVLLYRTEWHCRRILVGMQTGQAEQTSFTPMGSKKRTCGKNRWYQISTISYIIKYLPVLPSSHLCVNLVSVGPLEIHHIGISNCPTDLATRVQLCLSHMLKYVEC